MSIGKGRSLSLVMGTGTIAIGSPLGGGAFLFLLLLGFAGLFGELGLFMLTLWLLGVGLTCGGAFVYTALPLPVLLGVGLGSRTMLSGSFGALGGGGVLEGGKAMGSGGM